MWVDDSHGAKLVCVEETNRQAVDNPDNSSIDLPANYKKVVVVATIHNKMVVTLKVTRSTTR